MKKNWILNVVITVLSFFIVGSTFAQISTGRDSSISTKLPTIGDSSMIAKLPVIGDSLPIPKSSVRGNKTTPGNRPTNGMRNGQNMNIGHFYGKVLESASSKPIEDASVQLIQSKFDTTTKKRKDVVIGGMLTSKKGEFSMENLPIMGNFRLKISAIGYTPIDQKVAFNINVAAVRSGDMSSISSAIDKDLGNFKLQIDAQQLQGVTVTATKPLLTMSMDRKVYNVEKDLTATGGTAVDVMKNVPSVSVDLDGNVTMRNASPQIFVDGRPTTLTLDQIPADDIATIEIITNPSAKFDASGGGAGILNIVMKKNNKPGYNGNVRAGIDSRGKPTVGGNLNVRGKKVNVFIGGNLNDRKSIGYIQTNRTDYLSNGYVNLNQKDGPISQGLMGNAKLGFDYFMDNRNTFTVAGNFNRGKFNTADFLKINMDTVYTGLDTAGNYGERTTNGDRNFKNVGSTISFKHNFAKPNKDITADINYNYSKNSNQSNYANQYFQLDGTPETGMYYQRYIAGGTNKFLTVQTDYENPITDNIKIEAGARLAIRYFTSYNLNSNMDSSGNYILDSILNSQYNFNDQVLAAYGTFSQKINKLSYQLGLRVESSKYNGLLVGSAAPFTNQFPLSLFPSAFVTYKINDKQSLQFNYSRKINRPNFFQLIPFIDYTDSLNLSIGNPNLVPEFTSLMEVSDEYQINNNHTFLGTLYFKNTNNLITKTQYKTANPNTAINDSIIMSTYENASRSYTMGIELTAKDKLTRWWDITTNVNFFDATINASNVINGANSNLSSWFLKFTNNIKLPKNYSFQINANYQSKSLVPSGNASGGRGGGFGPSVQPTAQGYINPMYGVDFAFKKDFLKNNAASLTLQFNDIFRLREYSTHSASVSKEFNFVQDNTRRQDPQVVRLNFAWRFGKMDVSLFKRKNMKEDTDTNQNTLQGM